jgi:hypothetical protein
MTISTRTPEGDCYRCPFCGAWIAVETSDPAGDSVCPQCGTILWYAHDALNELSEPGGSCYVCVTEIRSGRIPQSDVPGLIEFLKRVGQMGILITDEDLERVRTTRDYRLVSEILARGPR